jgi:hypothetical protein
MIHYRPTAAAIALTLTVITGAAGQSDFGAGTPESRYFRTELAVSAGRRGPQVEGYVYNLYDAYAIRVLLRIDAVDASGRPLETRRAYVPFDVPPRGRSFFQVAAPAGTASARVSVESFEWTGRGAGGGGGGGGM